MTAVQKGTTLKIGLGSFVYTGYVASAVTVTYPNGNVEIHKDADGATMTKIFMDPSTKIEFDAVVLGASGSTDAPIDGAAVGVIPPKGTLTTFMSDGSSGSFGSGATRLSLKLIKEDSMTYT
jgi:hypothetical protein